MESLRSSIPFAPTGKPWNLREMDFRQPDGHVFRKMSDAGQNEN